MSPFMKILTWLRRFSVTLIVLFLFVKLWFDAAFVPAIPRPQHPPEGFEVSRTVTRIEWQLWGAADTFRVEVAKDRPNFNDPIVREISDRNHFNLFGLQPGRKYYWRVKHNGKYSAISSFSVSKEALSY